MDNVDIKYKNLLLKIIKQELPDCHIILFGSRARRTNHPGSDIDIALDTNGRIDIRAIGRIKEVIDESNIPFFVDVVDLHAVSPAMREEIMKEGVLWNT